eukprot:TRINITY_DN10622_c0_g1_i1.p1 TRINITY_DN10622_c0_g1~~TRINITY_DN10622_c0_g1_i1.p1  ORF type:complete len:195 (-),score=56.29 TRINITY_DN10622_c0_g1_i1:44-628(-)
MATRGKEETSSLINSMKDQLNRLVTQLQDVEELKEDLDEDEYESTKSETLAQMKEFKLMLEKTIKGDMTLVNDLGAIQLAIQAAVSEAFKTPEVIKLFAKKGTSELRTRLANLQRDQHLGKISQGTYTQQAAEILTALKTLGEKLSAEELSFVENNKTAALAAFERVESSSDIGAASKKAVLSAAGTQIKNSQG